MNDFRKGDSVFIVLDGNIFPCTVIRVKKLDKTMVKVSTMGTGHKWSSWIKRTLISHQPRLF